MAVAPFPSVSGGKGKQDAVFGRVLSWNVPAKSKSPELAVEFLRRMTSVEYGTLRSKELGAVSPLRNVPPPAGITNIDKTLKDAEKAEFILYGYGSGSAQFGLGDAWYNPVVEMWLGKLTPEAALAKIDTNMEAVRAQRAAAKK